MVVSHWCFVVGFFVGMCLTADRGCSIALKDRFNQFLSPSPLQINSYSKPYETHVSPSGCYGCDETITSSGPALRWEATEGDTRKSARKPLAVSQTEPDFLNLTGVDYVEIYCSNARQAAHWYCSVFGFQPVANAGLETGLKDRSSYVVSQGQIRLMLTSSLVPSGEIADHVKLHGDGVRVVALTTEDARQAYREASRRGARSYLRPKLLTDNDGQVLVSGVHTFGDTVHLFVERTGYRGDFLPGFRKWEYAAPKFDTVGLKEIDHVVANVPKGEMDKWCHFYETTFGMTKLVSFDEKDISTQYTSLKSKVSLHWIGGGGEKHCHCRDLLQPLPPGSICFFSGVFMCYYYYYYCPQVMSNASGSVKLPINEPAEGLKRSQIQEFLDFYHSPGVQHIALATENIVRTVKLLKARGCEFLTIPESYYDTVHERCGPIDEDLEQLKKHGVLVDRDEDGYLLQIFTKPTGDRPTFFIEILQRKGAQSFGKGNFKALFQSIEDQQRKRGTLDKD